MSAYLTTTIRVKDPESFEEYAGKAVPVINEHGGETIMMGGVAELLAGQADHEYEVVIRGRVSQPCVTGPSPYVNQPCPQARFATERAPIVTDRRTRFQA